ncbi:uncharacterized protein LOC113301564 [Papaver somniferum]|nr:uncharacterized protein LOC113301564 [Papaver somniferum]XP_026406123.1 uncharacterized protein LOC113301564 [Papaver somniferum]XP_026406124.1 uncharacterized protein LOC113301564 [Papaver somniferum]
MNQQVATGACMNEGAGAKHMSYLTSRNQSDTSDEEVAMSCIVADLFASLQFGKLDDIRPLEEVKHRDKFEDSTGTGSGDGAGVEDASCLTNKEAHYIWTSDEEVAMSCVVADLFASLQFGKLDDICAGEEGKSRDKFVDSTGTGLGDGAGVEDASCLTNKEARYIWTSDKRDDGPYDSDDLSSEEHKGTEGTDELYEFLARNGEKHNGQYIPFREIEYGNYHDYDISKHPSYYHLKY